MPRTSHTRTRTEGEEPKPEAALQPAEEQAATNGAGGDSHGEGPAATASGEATHAEAASAPATAAAGTNGSGEETRAAAAEEPRGEVKSDGKGDGARAAQASAPTAPASTRERTPQLATVPAASTVPSATSAARASTGPCRVTTARTPAPPASGRRCAARRSTSALKEMSISKLTEVAKASASRAPPRCASRS